MKYPSPPSSSTSHVFTSNTWVSKSNTFYKKIYIYIKKKQLPTIVKKKKKFNNLVGHSPYGTWWPTCEVLELGGLGYFTKYPSPPSSGTKLGHQVPYVAH